MKQQKQPKMESSHPADKSDEAWEIRGYDSWNFYREINLPLCDSQYANGLFADQLMTAPRVSASQDLNDSPTKRFNELDATGIIQSLDELESSKVWTPNYEMN
jgi:hypothetical protein